MTNELTKAWSGYSIKDYKALKGIKKGNLRDNMTDLELVLNSLAEITTTELCKTYEPIGFNEVKSHVIAGDTVASSAKKDIEARLGHSVISTDNADQKDKLIANKK